jgi:hypothetical protein
MKRTSTKRRQESGVVLLIAIFVLLLVSVVAIALIVSSGTETALAANYRSSAAVQYAAMAGLEEARGRLQPKNPDYFNKTNASFMPPAGTALQLGHVRYIINPAAGEAVNPQDTSSPYYDDEYRSEFNGTRIEAVPDVQTIASISGNNADGIPGPLFKWVRINAVTKASMNVNVNGGGSDSTTLLYYDPYGSPKPSLIVAFPPPASTVQVLEVTSLAVLPNGSKKLLQYITAPISMNLQFPAALTLAGNNVQFAAPNTNYFYIDGRDQFDVGACTAGSTPYTAVGYVNNSDGSDGTITGAIVPPASYNSHYTGVGGVTPNVRYVPTGSPPNALPPNLLRPSGLDSLVQQITGYADSVVTPTPGGPGTLGTTTTQSDVILPGMTAANPMTVVVNGNLDVTGWHTTGYGLLVVTGTFTYDPDLTWRGIVLVIGQGKFTANKFGSGEIDGALFIAKTRYPPGGGPTALQLIPDAGGALPDANLGQATFDQTNGGNGVFYSSCWIKAAQTGTRYKVLSFREIPQ